MPILERTKEEQMRFESGPTPSLGLLHILEDALSLLEGKDLPAHRRAYVLAESEKLVNDAQEGSRMSGEGELFVPPGKWRALKSFVLLDRYLGGPRNKIEEKTLQEILAALTSLTKNQVAPEDLRQGAVTALRDICEQMERDISLNNIEPSIELAPIAL
jgi:hypothetical protein